MDGVISLEGTLIGITGSALIAAAFLLTTRWTLPPFLIIAAAGTVGNLADSLLGALLERKGIIGNNTVNFLNTLIAALFALAFSTPAFALLTPAFTLLTPAFTLSTPAFALPTPTFY